MERFGDLEIRTHEDTGVCRHVDMPCRHGGWTECNAEFRGAQPANRPPRIATPHHPVTGLSIAQLNWIGQLQNEGTARVNKVVCLYSGHNIDICLVHAYLLS